MKKECLVCTKPIKGRIDKKFCSDSCRNAFNNKNTSSRSSHIRNVNVILARNRKILEDFIVAQVLKVSRIKLEQKGFNFYYYTHVSIAENEMNCFFCYEYGYSLIEKDYYVLVKQDDSDYC